MIVLFFGVPSAGKTLAQQDYVRAHAREQAFLVVDRANEWELRQDNKRWRGTPPPGAEVEYRSDLEALARELLDDGGFKPGVHIFGPPWSALEVAELGTLVGDCVYVDDEIDLVATYKDWLNNPLRAMVHRGRHLPNLDGVPCELHVLGAARRVQNLHSDLTSMSDEVFIFRVQGAATLKRLVQEGMLEPGEEEEARSQQNLQYILWKAREPGMKPRGVLAPVK